MALVYEHLMRTPEQRSIPWMDRCRGQVKAALTVLDQSAEDAGPWLLGDRLTQADITVATMLGFLALVEPATRVAHPDDRHWPHLARLAERCEAESALVACYPPETERPLPPDFKPWSAPI